MVPSLPHRGTEELRAQLELPELQEEQEQCPLSCPLLSLLTGKLAQKHLGPSLALVIE